MNKPYGKKFKGPGQGFKKFKGGPNRPKSNSFKKFSKPDQTKRFNKQKPKFGANKKFRRNKTDAKSLDDQLNNYWGDDKKVLNSHMDKQLDDYWKDKKEKVEEKEVPKPTDAKTEEKKQEEKK